VTHLEPTVPWSGDFSGKANVPRFFDAIANSVQTTAFTPQESSRTLTRSCPRGEYGCTVNATGKTSLAPGVHLEAA
jgi:hypothetical protein